MSNPQDHGRRRSRCVSCCRTARRSRAPRTIRAKQRITVNPVDAGDRASQNAAFSTIVTSDVRRLRTRDVLAGRRTPFGEGHASSGVTTHGADWVLAEGRERRPDGYTTYILLANPQRTAADVTVTFLRETGAPIVEDLTVPATSRYNVDVGARWCRSCRANRSGRAIQVTNNVADRRRAIDVLERERQLLVGRHQCAREHDSAVARQHRRNNFVGNPFTIRGMS